MTNTRPCRLPQPPADDRPTTPVAVDPSALWEAARLRNALRPAHVPRMARADSRPTIPVPALEPGRAA